MTTSRHFALAAAALMGEPGLSDLRHLVLGVEEPKRIARARRCMDR
jgi:hypothetical protein